MEAWDPARIQAALQAAKAADASFANGEILGSMCTEPHGLARAVFADFLHTNLGDPGHFPGTAKLEQELLADLAELVGGTHPDQARLVTGGTEANLLACYLARREGKTEIVVPEHAHFSFEKAARLLQMTLVRTPDENHRADVGAIKAALGPKTALVVAVAGSTELGLVDPVAAIAAVAAEAGVPCHVDAAFGGYVLPFLPGAAPFGLDVSGVTSVAVDPHKMGMCPIPAGALVLRDATSWKDIAVQTPYVSTDGQSTLLGTRTGGAAAAAWAVHRSLGSTGYAQVVATCMETTGLLAKGLKAAGRRLVAEPELNVVTFASDDPTAEADRLASAGFRLNVVPGFSALRIVVNPHVTPAVAQRFLEAL